MMRLLGSGDDDRPLRPPHARRPGSGRWSPAAARPARGPAARRPSRGRRGHRGWDRGARAHRGSSGRLAGPRTGNRAASRHARDLGGRFQQLAQPLPCPVQQHADGVHRDRQVPGDLAVAPFLQVMEAERLGLIRRQGTPARRGATRLSSASSTPCEGRGDGPGRASQSADRPVVGRAGIAGGADPWRGPRPGGGAGHPSPAPARGARPPARPGTPPGSTRPRRRGCRGAGRPSATPPPPSRSMISAQSGMRLSGVSTDPSTHPVAGGLGFLTDESRACRRAHGTSAWGGSTGSWHHADIPRSGCPA